MRILKIRLILGILLIITVFCCEGEDDLVKGLLINEFLAINDNCYMDEYGEYDDWVEIFNSNDMPIDIGGMYFSDKTSYSDPYQVSDSDSTITTIQPGDFLVLWCDGDIEQGLLHLNLKLSGNGESITLLGKDSETVIDSYTFGKQTTDVSMGRIDDDWIYFEVPTPGQANYN